MPENTALMPVNTWQGQQFYLNLPKAVTPLHNTELGESIEHIAKEQTSTTNPKVIQSYVQQLIKLNADVLQNMGIPPSKANIYRPLPYSTLLLPQQGTANELNNVNTFKAKQHAKMINKLPFQERKILHEIINHPDIDLVTYNSVAMATHYMQHLAHALNEEKRRDVTDMATNMGLAIADRYTDALKDMAKDLKQSLAETEEALGKYLSATDANKKMARDAFLEAHHELNKNFNIAVEHLNALQLNVKNAAYYKNASHLVQLRKAGKIVKLVDLDAFKTASRLVKFTTTTGYLMFAGELIEAANDTYNAYEEHKDWMAKLAEGLTEVGVGGAAGYILGGLLVSVELPPIMLFAGAAIAGSLAYKIGELFESSVEFFLKGIQDD